MTKTGKIVDRRQLESWDADDELGWAREQFLLPAGTLYFDGNSLGPLTRGSRDRVREVTERQWGKDLITSWNAHGWIDLPSEVGAKLSPLLGAAEGQVVACDSVSVNLLKVLSAALALRPDRRTILCQADHFPTDLYIAQGLADLVRGSGRDVRLRYLEVDEMEAFLRDDPGASDVVGISLGHVDFRRGRLFPMAEITAAAHRAGALTVWDLSHSVGALPVELDGCEVDFAVGCGYKFLNGGPGAPAFLYAAQRHQKACRQPLQGWLGHREPFAFARDYRPAAGVERFVCGTPPIVALASLDAALELWQRVDLEVLRRKSERLGDLFLELVGRFSDELGLRVDCPTDASQRGSQVCLAHEHGYAVMQALIERGVVGDFRAPNILRFGLTPLYQRYVDIWDAVLELEKVLRDGIYRESRFQVRSKVT